MPHAWSCRSAAIPMNAKQKIACAISDIGWDFCTIQPATHIRAIWAIWGLFDTFCFRILKRKVFWWEALDTLDFLQHWGVGWLVHLELLFSFLCQNLNTMCILIRLDPSSIPTHCWKSQSDSVCRLVAFALEDAMFKQCKARRDALVFDYVCLGIYLISICTSNKQCVLDVSSSSVFVLSIDELGILLFASEQVPGQMASVLQSLQKPSKTNICLPKWGGIRVLHWHMRHGPSAMAYFLWLLAYHISKCGIHFWGSQ